MMVPPAGVMMTMTCSMMKMALKIAKRGLLVRLRRVLGEMMIWIFRMTMNLWKKVAEKVFQRVDSTLLLHKGLLQLCNGATDLPTVQIISHQDQSSPVLS